MSDECTHLDSIEVTQVTRHVCDECVKSGARWLHLRMCLACGHMGCCDDSPNRHATKHYGATKHPLIRSAEPGESWVWCYPDELVATELD